MAIAPAFRRRRISMLGALILLSQGPAVWARHKKDVVEELDLQDHNVSICLDPNSDACDQADQSWTTAWRAQNQAARDLIAAKVKLADAVTKYPSATGADAAQAVDLAKAKVADAQARLDAARAAYDRAVQPFERSLSQDAAATAARASQYQRVGEELGGQGLPPCGASGKPGPCLNKTRVIEENGAPVLYPDGSPVRFDGAGDRDPALAGKLEALAKDDSQLARREKLVADRLAKVPQAKPSGGSGPAAPFAPDPVMTPQDPGPVATQDDAQQADDAAQNAQSDLQAYQDASNPTDPAAADNARQHLDQQLQDNPNNQAALDSRATLNFKQGDNSGACADASAALAVNPSDDHAFGIGQLACPGGIAAPAVSAPAAPDAGAAPALAGSVPTISPAAISDPAASAVSAKAALAAMKAGDLHGAVEAATAAIQADPANTQGWSVRAAALKVEGNYSQALSDMGMALRYNPDNLTILNTKSGIQNRMKDYKGALATAERALKVDPQSAAALANKAFALGGEGDRAGMIEALKAAASIDPQFQAALQKVQDPSSDTSALYGGSAAQERPAPAQAPPRKRTAKLVAIAVGAIAALGMGIFLFGLRRDEKAAAVLLLLGFLGTECWAKPRVIDRGNQEVPICDDPASTNCGAIDDKWGAAWKAQNDANKDLIAAQRALAEQAMKYPSSTGQGEPQSLTDARARVQAAQQRFDNAYANYYQATGPLTNALNQDAHALGQRAHLYDQIAADIPKGIPFCGAQSGSSLCVHTNPEAGNAVYQNGQPVLDPNGKPIPNLKESVDAARGWSRDLAAKAQAEQTAATDLSHIARPTPHNQTPGARAPATAVVADPTLTPPDSGPAVTPQDAQQAADAQNKAQDDLQAYQNARMPGSDPNSVDNAKQYLDQQLKDNPNNVGALDSRATLNFKQGNNAAACDDAKAAIAINPNDDNAYGIGQLACPGGMNRPAGFNPAANALGAAEPGESTSLGGSVVQVSPAANPDPANSASFMEAARKYAELGNLDRAIDAAGDAVRQDPRNVQAWLFRASGLSSEGNYAQALSDLNQALSYSPNNLDLINAKARVQNHLKDYKGALASAERAILLNPTSAAAYANKAYALGGLGDREGMITALKTAASLDPQFQAALDQVLNASGDAAKLFDFPDEKKRPAQKGKAQAGTGGGRNFLLALGGVAILGAAGLLWRSGAAEQAQ